MYKVVTSQFEEFEEFEDALRCVEGRFMLRSRKQADWELSVVDLNGVSLSLAKTGAAHFFNGAGSAGQFTFFVLLSRHEDFTLDGVQFGRHKIGWLVPERSFHACARRPPTMLSVAISRDRVLSWLSSHPENDGRCPAVLETSAKFGGLAAASFVRLAHRILAWDKRHMSRQLQSGNRESSSARAARRRIRSASPDQRPKERRSPGQTRIERFGLCAWCDRVGD